MLPDFLKTFLFESAIPQLKRVYPNSLDFGASYVSYLLRQVYSKGIAPRIAVSFSMLDKSISSENYESEIARRHRALQNQTTEIQGYVKPVLVLVAFFFVNEKIIRELGSASQEDVQQRLLSLMPRVAGFSSLPRDLQLSGMTYVAQNVFPVLDELAGNADVDVRELMNRIARRAERDSFDEFYKRGTNTAADTFSFYFELISRIPPHWVMQSM